MHHAPIRTPRRRRRRPLPALPALLALLAFAGLTAAPVPGHGPARAQTVVRADPLDPAAPVPPLLWRSPLTAYPAWRDEPVVDWRAANDAVGRVGGWRAYAREAAEARASAPGGVSSTPVAPSAAPVPARPAAPAVPRGTDPHGGHR